MRISQDTVQKILQAADVTEIVGEYVSLKKRGANMIACCPFHNEKTPSFYVSPAKQIYKCFGCGKSGDSVRFVMDIEGIGYPEALRHLAKKYGIEVEEREYSNAEVQAQNEKESLYIVLDFASKYYQDQLWKSSEGESIGQSYFKERGFNHATIQKFDLGYSPESWDAFTKHAIKNGFSLEILEKAGLTIIREGKDPIDRFRGRVIFPIHNVAGKPIAFGARILKKDPNAPKYLNSPETAVYHKSYIVYGISNAKNAIRQEDNCYLVEGYTDVVSLNQAGIENVVASSGTSLTKEQIQLIRRFTNNITVLYDGDAAGIKASLRGIDIILEEGLNVKSVVFPDGDDPDSFVQKVGSQAFKEFVKKNEKDVILFSADLLLEDAKNDPIQRVNVMNQLKVTLSKIPDRFKREELTTIVANKFDLFGERQSGFITEVNKEIAKRNKDKSEEKQKEDYLKQRKEETNGNDLNTLLKDTNVTIEPSNPSYNLTDLQTLLRTPLSYHEEECARLLVCYGNHILEKTLEGDEIRLVDYVFDQIKDLTFETEAYNKILSIFRDFYDRHEVPDTLHFTSHQDENIQQLTISWLTSPHQLSENWRKHDIYVPEEAEKLADLAYTNILRLKKARFETEIHTLTTQLTEAETYEAQEQILIRMMQVKEVIKKIASMLGTVVQG